MSSPAHPVIRSSGDERPPMPWTADDASPTATLHVECGRAGLARARSFTREILRAWSLGHRCDDATVVISELATNAVVHAAPRCAGRPDVRLGFRLDPAYLLLAVSDADDHPPVHRPAAPLALEQHGRGLGIVDALSEEWGWLPTPPAGKTVWARLATHPPI